MGVGHGSSDKLVMYERGSLDNVNNSSVACVNSPDERESKVNWSLFLVELFNLGITIMTGSSRDKENEQTSPSSFHSHKNSKSKATHSKTQQTQQASATALILLTVLRDFVIPDWTWDRTGQSQ